MSSRCGIDIIELERFERLLKNSETQQMQEIFTAREWQDCTTKANLLQSLAARFALKEACLKLFPAETNRKELLLIDIEVLVDNEGAPFIFINDKLKKIFHHRQLTYINASISHTTHYACAIAIAG